MKTTNALVAAALAGVFAAGTTLATASPAAATEVIAGKEKDKCPAKDKEKKEEDTALAGKDKDKCPAKDKEKKEEDTVLAGKEKDKCPAKDKDKDKEEEAIL